MINRIFTAKRAGKSYVFKRINKRSARAAYNNGLTVIFSPCNMRPFNNYFGLDMDINKDNINCQGQDFNKILNAYEYYNCNAETGKYTAFIFPLLLRIDLRVKKSPSQFANLNGAIMTTLSLMTIVF